MSATAESWESVRDFSGYEVSDLGGIRSYWSSAVAVKGGGRRFRKQHDEPRPIHPFPGPSGVLYVTLYNTKGLTKNASLARLILAAFDRKPQHNEVADYLDGNPANCDRSNLRWATRKDVAKRKQAAGIKVGARTNLTAAQRKAIKSARKKPGATDIAVGKEFGVSRETVRRLCHKPEATSAA